MRVLFIILILQVLYSQDIHRGCMKESNSRSYDSRPDYLSETYLSPSGHFMIHYDQAGSDDSPVQTDVEPENGIPDYVEQVGIIADSTRQILTEVMGFREEIDDSDGKYDIYIVNLGGGINAAYGWNYVDGDDDITGTSWVEIDNDYIEDAYYTHGLKAMRVTVAHEFFHAIQRAYHEKSKGTYIEGGIYPVDYGYFYEFTSMWIEDVIVPDGDDYLHFMASSGDGERFFSNPEQKFSDTDGYSVALYGHYLSSVIEGIEDETLNTIIKQTWEKFSDELLDPIDAFDAVLTDYNSSFIESWVDFCSRNLHNGQFPDINNDIYYYIDQTSTILDELGISNANLHQGYIGLDESIDTLSLIGDNHLLEFELDNRSIRMHSIVADSVALLAMAYSDMPDLGKYIITEVESPNINNAQIDDVSSDPILVNTNNTLHFIYSGSSPSLINVSVNPSYFPTIPDIMSVLNIDEGIEIAWNASEGEGELEYNIYRNSELLNQTSDTYYIDTNIEPNLEYIYSISCSNAIGESDSSESISIISWPDDDDVITTKIISLYPNPLYRPGFSSFNLVVDYGSSIENVDIIVYDIQGREILFRNLGVRNQGRSEEKLGPFLSSGLSSGIYFLHLKCDETTLKQKFTILK